MAITGVTGWLGSVLLHMAARAGLSTSEGRLRLFGSVARKISLPNGDLALVERLDEAPPLEGEGWLVAHFAALGKERTEDLSAETFVEASHRILDHALRIIEPAHRPRMIFTSSGAVYSAPGVASGPAESPYGYVKRIHEERVSDWCEQRAVPLILPRIFNVGGPWGNKLGRYALSSIVQSALGRRPITLQARRPVFRSYVHVEELMAVLVHRLSLSEVGRAIPFDTCGREVVEIGTLARMVCETLGGEAPPIIRHYDRDADADWYVGDPCRYQTAVESAGLSCLPLSVIIADTAAELSAAALEESDGEGGGFRRVDPRRGHGGRRSRG